MRHTFNAQERLEDDARVAWADFYNTVYGHGTISEAEKHRMKHAFIQGYKEGRKDA